MKKTKKFFALVMAMCMIFSMTSVIAFAEDAVGTAETPEVLDDLSYNSIVIDADVETYDYYYSYAATDAAEILFYFGGIYKVTGVDEDGYYELDYENESDAVIDFIVTNQTTGDVATFSEDAAYNAEYDFDTMLVEVAAGDELLIQLNKTAGVDWVNVYWMGNVNYPEGTANNPLTLEDENGQITVPAGSDLYVQTYFAGGTITIENADGLSIRYGMMPVQPVDGVMEFYLDPPNPMMGVFSPHFTITNSGDEDITCTYSFDIPVGTEENPEELESVEDVETTLEDADSSSFTGNAYFYKYYAEADGMFTFWIDGVAEEGIVGDISVMNSYTYDSMSLSADGVQHEGYNRLQASLYVTEGDELIISVATEPDDLYNYPAATITWSATMVAGTEEDPIVIPSDSFAQKIPAGTEFVFVGDLGQHRLTITEGYTSFPDWDMYEIVYVVYDGKTYTADEDGTIVVDFGGEAGDSVTFVIGEETGSMVGNFNVAISEIEVDDDDDSDNNNNNNDNNDNNNNNNNDDDNNNLAPDNKVDVEASVDMEDTKIEVSAPSDEAVNDVATAGKETLKDKIYEVLELDLFKGNTQLTELANKIKVTLSVFDKIKDAKWVAVYRLDGDKLTSLGTVEVKDGKFTFETDHFSTYVFAVAEEPKADAEPDTGDMAPVAAMFAIAALAATAVVVSKKKVNEM